MKKPARIYAVLCLIIACMMLLSPACALAGGMEVKPLEEEIDSSYMEYLIPEVNLSILLPVTADNKMVMDEQGQKALQIYNPDMPDTYFIFFAIQADLLKGLSLTGLDEKGIRSVLEMIFINPSSLTYKAINDFVPSVTVLRVPEGRDGIYAEHLVALKDGWVLNMMAKRLDGNESLTKEEVEYQEKLLSNVLNQGGLMTRLNSYSVPDAGISFTLPDSMYMHLVTDEPDRKELYVSPLKPGVQTPILHLFIIRSPAFKNKTVKDLPEKTRQAALIYPTFTSFYDESSLAVLDDFVPGIPAIRYESDGSSKHLMAIKDGWALYTSIYPHPLNESMDPNWVEKVQNALMRSMLDGDGDIPEWLPAYPIKQEDNVLMFPLQSRILEIQIPKGFGVDITRDAGDARYVYFYALDDSPNRFHIGSKTLPEFTGDKAMDEVYTTRQLIDLCAGFSNSMYVKGVTPWSAMDIGPLGISSVHTITNEKIVEQYYFILDSTAIALSFVSEDGPITKEESALLMNLIQK